MPQSRIRRDCLTSVTRRTALRLGAGGIVATLLTHSVAVGAQNRDRSVLASIALPPMPGDTSWLSQAIAIPPGQETVWTATYGRCCPGPRIEYVLSGTYRVRAEHVSQVLRAGGDEGPETVAARVEVVLQAGDTRIARSEDPFVAASPRATPVELLLGAIGPGEPAPLGWRFGATD